jgi:uncharacterized protein (TIGR03086 family)
MLDLGPAALEVARLAGGVSDDQLPVPTPCYGCSVAVLLGHLMNLARLFTAAARKMAPGAAAAGWPGMSRPAPLDPGWRAALPRRLAVLAATWRDPAAWQGMSAAAGMTMPGDIMGAVVLDELVLHGWDLARATGQKFRCDPDSAAAVLAFTSASARPAGAVRTGLFGPVVEVPGDAPALDRALGLAGRDPSWLPG